MCPDLPWTVTAVRRASVLQGHEAETRFELDAQGRLITLVETGYSPLGERLQRRRQYRYDVAVALRRHWRSGAVAAFSWSCFFSWRLINDGLRAPATLELPWTIAIHVTAVLAGLWILRQRFAPEGATSPCDA